MLSARRVRLGRAALVIAASFLAASVSARDAWAQFELGCLEFDTELVSLELTGGPFPLPLATDPANALGDSVEGWGWVNSTVTITLSSQRPVTPGPASVGTAFAFPNVESFAGAGEGEGQCTTPIDPNQLDGEEFFVDSFFDVFFDITVTDVDARPGRDFAGLPDGMSFPLIDNGPANMASFYIAIFDKDAPNFGLIPPPEADPYIGHFNIEIPLGVDINANGENDKVKFTLATHSVGDGNRTFVTLPDGTVIDEFDSGAFLEGAVVDESSDPPFTIGSMLPSGLPDPAVFGGPTTATSNLLTPIVGVLDHFMFYGVKATKGAPKTPKFGPVHLQDQFDLADYDVIKPLELGLPADKNGEGFQDPEGPFGTHLKKYKVKRSKGQPKFTERLVDITNQCNQNLVVEVKKPDSLLVPSLKGLVAPPSGPFVHVVDHFLCYKAKVKDFPKGMQVTVLDQFDDPNRVYDLKGITKVCNPVAKSGQPIILSGPDKGAPFLIDPAFPVNPDAHLVCYKAKLAKKTIPQAGCGAIDPKNSTKIDPKQEKHAKIGGLFVLNQFGLEQLDTIIEREFCIPSAKQEIL